MTLTFSKFVIRRIFNAPRKLLALIKRITSIVQRIESCNEVAHSRKQSKRLRFIFLTKGWDRWKAIALLHSTVT